MELENSTVRDDVWCGRERWQHPMEDERPQERRFNIGDIAKDGDEEFKILEAHWDGHDWWYECWPIGDADCWYVEKYECEFSA